MMPFIPVEDHNLRNPVNAVFARIRWTLRLSQGTTTKPPPIYHQSEANIKTAPNRPSRTAETANASNANANLANKEGIEACWSQHL
jgi:hypothetical protein